jgi:hypothetical protein
MIVFSKGEWIDVLLPKGYDPCWSKADTFAYATLWVACIERGFDEKKASQVAEAAVIKRMYPELLYSRELEDDIKSLYS